MFHLGLIPWNVRVCRQWEVIWRYR